jgi:CPA1 family monovalent cation:H+ antiporter
MFGHVSILSRSPRRIEVRALTHGTLFRLDEAELRGLLGRCPELKRRVEDRVRVLAEQEREGAPSKADMMSGTGVDTPKSA